MVVHDVWLTNTHDSDELETIKEQNANLQICVLHLQEEINENQGKIRKVRDVSTSHVLCKCGCCVTYHWKRWSSYIPSCWKRWLHVSMPMVQGVQENQDYSIEHHVQKKKNMICSRWVIIEGVWRVYLWYESNLAEANSQCTCTITKRTTAYRIWVVRPCTTQSSWNVQSLLSIHTFLLAW